MLRNYHIRLLSLLTEENTPILHEVLYERLNQEALKAAGKFKYSCADKEMDEQDKFLVLGEETGEVARAILNGKGLARDVVLRDLRTELIQVAAVCVAWVECLDKK